LIDTDARLALRRAEVLADVRRAELHSATADLTAARQRLEFPVHLQAELAEAQSILAKSESERAKLPFLIEAAEAQATWPQKYGQRVRPRETRSQGCWSVRLAANGIWQWLISMNCNSGAVYWKRN
jgi:hypothetical protein